MLKQQLNMTNLGIHMYDWVINYNPFTSNWQAAHRDNMNALYSDRTKLIESPSLLTLVEILNKTNGIRQELDKLLGNGTSN